MTDEPTHTILTDDQFDELVSIDVAVPTIRRAIESHATGDLAAPPRFSVDGEHGSLVFTAGVVGGDGGDRTGDHELDDDGADAGANTDAGDDNDAGNGTDADAATDADIEADADPGEVMGFRVYETIPDSPAANQLVVTYDGETGALEGVIVGDRVGAVRTGAIGGVAVDELARPDARTLGIIGAGKQARTQLRAAATVRSFDRVSVYSPTRASRERFANELGSALDLDVRPVASSEDAVRGADVLITATTSREPVFDPAWLEPGVHVNTVGPKFLDAHELDPAVAEEADVIATDSLDQVDGYDRRFLLADTPQREAMVELGALVTGSATGRQHDEETTLFCSVGLAGTEVALAHEAFGRFGAESGPSGR